MAGVDKGDSFPEPGALFVGQVGEKGEEVALVAAPHCRPLTIAPPRGIGLVEEDDFRADCGQAPGGLPGTTAQRQADKGLAPKDPIAAGELVELNVEAEAGLHRCVEAVREATARVRSPSVDVGGEIEAAAVPGLATVARDVVVMADQLPPGEVIKERVLVVLKDDEIKVSVVAGLAAEPRVDGPAAAEVPPGTERGHEVGDASEGFWDGGHRLVARTSKRSSSPRFPPSSLGLTSTSPVSTRPAAPAGGLGSSTMAYSVPAALSA